MLSVSRFSTSSRISDIGWFWATDAEGKLSYLSASAARRLGKPIEELLGTAVSGLFLADQEKDEDRTARPLSFQLRARNRSPTYRCAWRKRAGEVVVGDRQAATDRERRIPRVSRQRKDITSVCETQRDASRARRSTIR